MNLLPILAEMEAIGVRIDREKLSDIGERIIEAIKLREQEIYDLV
jgi:DNA polymerase I-like protein with 3'-5' exonuclease and polymerase domains